MARLRELSQIPWRCLTTDDAELYLTVSLLLPLNHQSCRLLTSIQVWDPPRQRTLMLFTMGPHRQAKEWVVPALVQAHPVVNLSARVFVAGVPGSETTLHAGVQVVGRPFPCCCANTTVDAVAVFFAGRVVTYLCTFQAVGV